MLGGEPAAERPVGRVQPAGVNADRYMPRVGRGHRSLVEQKNIRRLAIFVVADRFHCLGGHAVLQISTNLLARYKAVQIATLVDSVPSGESSVHEMKYDGYRTMVAVGGGEARAYTRSLSGWRRSRSRYRWLRIDVPKKMLAAPI
jgi:hypothetical protein